ncbi:MAG TPA: gas vesicle protein GvpJ [Actinomycetota bacterium]|nr:gas vesicle protein GvpJ [Actinomycetota bacterium]
MAQQGMSRGGPSGLAEVLDVLLDKGLVIDVFVRVSLVGIELLTIDARVVIASVDTYLRFAEAVNRLDLQQANNSQNLGDLIGGKSKALSSKGSPRRDDPAAENDGSDDEPDDRPKDGPAGDVEPEASKGSDEPADEEATDDADTDDEGEQDDKGILSRIKERGQVF